MALGPLRTLDDVIRELGLLGAVGLEIESLVLDNSVSTNLTTMSRYPSASVSVKTPAGANVEVHSVISGSVGVINKKLYVRVVRVNLSQSTVVGRTRFFTSSLASSTGSERQLEFSVWDTPPAGNHRYDIQWAMEPGAGAAYSSGAEMLVKVFNPTS